MTSKSAFGVLSLSTKTSVSLVALCPASQVLMHCFSGRRLVANILWRQTHYMKAIKHVGEISSSY